MRIGCSSLTRIVSSLLFAIFLLGAPPAWAQTSEPTPENPLFQYLEFKIGGWFTSADADWKISGALFPGIPANVAAFVSDLEFDDIDSNMVVLEIRTALFKGVSLDFAFGFGTINDGKNTDTDFFTIPSQGLNNALRTQSIADLDGDTKFITANINFRLLPFMKAGPSYLDLSFGYFYYEDKLTMTNGVSTVSSGVPVSSPFAGLSSTYDFYWQALSLGIRGQYALPAHFFLRGKMNFFPFVLYEGEGVWNLRSDFAQNPSFEHDADNGFGYDLSASLAYSPHPNFLIELGYRRFMLEVKDGDDKTFFSDGTSARSTLDRVRAARSGFFVSFSILF